MKKFLPTAIALIIFFNANAQSGSNCNNAIPIIPTATCSPTSYTTTDSVVYLSFVANQKYAQIVGVSSVPLGTAAPHIHRLTLFSGSCSTLQIMEDEFLPNIIGATELQIDASNLTIGNTYYVRFTREPSRASAGCAPTPSPTGECHASMTWNFNFCISSPNILIPKDFALEPAAISHAYYTGKGQIIDINYNPRHDIKCYSRYSSPEIYVRDTSLSFIFAHIDTAFGSRDSFQRVDMNLVASNPNVRNFKTEKIFGYLNYFLPHAKDGATNIKGYSRDIINDVYPNIDMQLYSNNAGMKFYFVVRPGGNADNIVMDFKGATSVNVTSSKGLLIKTPLGNINFNKGNAYQINPAGNIVPMPWQADFIQVSPTSVKLDIRSYPTNLPLFIEIDRGHSTPQSIQNLDWSTYYSGTGGDEFRDVKTDTSGNVYLTGYSGSVDFPFSTGAYDSTRQGGWDVVIVKFDSSGVRQFATYLGGYHNDMGRSIGTDKLGNVYIAGWTKSVNYPTVQPAGSFVQPKLNGNGVTLPNPFSDVCISKLNSAGNTLIWSTFYGDTAFEEARDLVIDGNQNLYVVGGHQTYLTTPVIPTFTQTGAFNSNIGTGFILKFDKFGGRLWATRIGGPPSAANNNTSATGLNSCAIDASNNFFVTGAATESGYPVLNPAGTSSYNTNLANTFDVIATKFNPSGAIVWSTYYGNKGDEAGNAIDVDKNGNAYITGWTTSPGSNPIQLASAGGWPKFYQPWYGGGQDAFIAEIAPAGSTLLWGTYLGGAGYETALNLSFDNRGDLFVVGSLGTSSFAYTGGLPLPNPNAPNAYVKTSPLGYQDGFISTFADHWYIWGTYFGGNGGEVINAASTYKDSKLYITGFSASGNNFPLDSAGGFPTWYQSAHSFNSNGYITRFDLAPILVLAMNEYDDSEIGINVFPNPTSQNILVEIELKEKEDINLSLYNLLGENIYSSSFKNSSGTFKKQISFAYFSSGVYILKIQLGNKTISKKIIKQY
ncbi:MAG: SBBP repeat-containing protein [Bacteroidetes bacterium]|nr:SBBP repeat-containing protein [Bacteroidota bacterium]